jgi:hypothetical protein
LERLEGLRCCRGKLEEISLYFPVYWMTSSEPPGSPAELPLWRCNWTWVRRLRLKFLVLFFGTDEKSELADYAFFGPFVLAPDHSRSIPIILRDFAD